MLRNEQRAEISLIRLELSQLKGLLSEMQKTRWQYLRDPDESPPPVHDPSDDARALSDDTPVPPA
eukprot:5767223-Pyramimonas_sp.AAC.2